MYCFRCLKTSDLAFNPATLTFLDLSSVQVMKYSNSWCERVGSLPQTSEKTRPRTAGERLSVDFRMSSRVCLPFTHGSQGSGSGCLPLISMPFTIPLLTICSTESALRGARQIG